MLNRHYTKEASHSQWLKVPWVNYLPFPFQDLLYLWYSPSCQAMYSAFCLLHQEHQPSTTSTTSTIQRPQMLYSPSSALLVCQTFILLFINAVIPWWSNIHNNCLVTLSTTMSGLLTSIIWPHWMVMSHNIWKLNV